MRILITGGAGFIGSWVTEAYLADGHEVLVIDNLSTGNTGNIHKEADFIEADILDKQKLESVVMEFKPDILNHHAAQTSVTHAVSDPVHDATNNIIGSLNLFEICKDSGLKKIIFASSGGAIYGHSYKLPIDESTRTDPLSPYGVSKLTTEFYLEYYKKNYGIDYTSLRYSNVYGERQNATGEAGVIAKFCLNIIQNKTCKVYGDGNQTRDYVYCKDVATANMKASSNSGGIFNIGTSIETSVNSIIENLKLFSGKNFMVSYENERIGEVRHNALDYNLANKELSWIPETDITSGIHKTWDWFSKRF